MEYGEESLNFVNVMHSKVFQRHTILYVYIVKCNAPPSYEMPRFLFFYFFILISFLKHFVWYEQFVCVWASLDFSNFPSYFRWERDEFTKLENQNIVLICSHSSHSVAHWLTLLLVQLTAYSTQSVLFHFTFIHMRTTLVEV